MKVILEKMKNIISSKKFKDKWFILLCCVFIFVLFLITMPHYDEDGKNVFIGTHYTLRSVDIDKKVKKLEQMEKTHLTGLTSQIIKLKHNVNELETENSTLKDQISVLNDKLIQQDNFYANKTKEEIKEKEDKKVRFSNVSKKQIKNDRPEFGNSFSKSIKKSKIDL